MSLSDKCDAAWNMYDIYGAWPGWLSRAQLWLWQSKLRQVCQRVYLVNGKELNGPLITSQGYKQKYNVTTDTQVFIDW